MPKLVAAAYEDGYALVEDGESVYLIRPPYSRRDKVKLNSAAVDSAIAAHGFSSAEGTFADWAALIDHLKEQFVRRRDAEPDTAQIRRLIQRAPRDKVLSFLDRIEHELIPGREWRAATGLLPSLLKNKILREDSALLERCTNLLEATQQAKEREEAARAGLLTKEPVSREAFPFAASHYPQAFELALMVRDAGRVLEVGSF